MKNILTESIFNKIDKNLKEDAEFRDYDVVVGFCGYIGVEEEYSIYASSKDDAVAEAIDNPGAEAFLDLSVDETIDNGDGSYTCIVSFAGNIGAEQEYEIYGAESEEEAEEQALSEAQMDLEIISVDGEEYTYESAKPKKLKEADEEYEEMSVITDQLWYVDSYGELYDLLDQIQDKSVRKEAIESVEVEEDNGSSPEEAGQIVYSDVLGKFSCQLNTPTMEKDYFSESEKVKGKKTLKEDEDYFDEDVYEAFKEEGSYDEEEIREKMKNYDYIFFPGVDNDEDLAHAYVDMCGGITAAVSADRLPDFFDVDAYREDNEADIRDLIASDYKYDSIDDVTDEELDSYFDAIIPDEVAVAIHDHNDEFFENYFNYKALGDELSYDYTYTKTGALCSW